MEFSECVASNWLTDMQCPKHALIFAGGLGTRLRPRVNDVPKPMAPVCGKPFLAYQIMYWIRQGITHFTLSVGYLAETIEAYFGASFCGATIGYVFEETPLGTGGALGLAFKLGSFDENPTLILNGDTWFEADIALLAKKCHAKNFVMTLALRELAENTRYGGVLTNENGLIHSFGDPNSMLINAGCYLISPPAVEPYLAQFPEKFSLEGELLPLLAKESCLCGCVQHVSFIDIGIPEDYDKFCAAAPNLGL